MQSATRMFRVLLALALACVAAVSHVHVASASEEARAKAIPSACLENLFSIDGKILSGSTPHDAASFAQLRELGVTTIISVDGASPEVEEARKFGLKYVHLPIGYDGASKSNANRIVKAALDSSGPIYVHCHHGKHRGPAAAAIIAASLGMWNREQGTAWLNQAGTSPSYPGLFKMVAEFEPPSTAELALVPNDFPERVPPVGMVDAMIEIDRHWDRLKGFKKRPSPTIDKAGLDSAATAALLQQAYRELGRSGEAKQLGAEFLGALQEAEHNAAALHKTLAGAEPSDKDESREQIWKATASDCASCHKRFRN